MFVTLHPEEHALKKKLNALAKKYAGQRILLNLQVSGGMDSMALLHALCKVLNSKLFANNKQFVVIAQHFNHRQRASESEADAELVVDACLGVGIPVSVCSWSTDVEGNFQEQARRWRRQEALLLCKSIATAMQFTKYFILTAHHARDHVETVLQHLVRGCALQGLLGIAEMDAEGLYWRPFIGTSYEALQAYAQQQKISFRTDSSNLTDVYNRNYIRHHLLPHLEHLNLNYQVAFRALSDAVAEQLSCSQKVCTETFLITSDTKRSELIAFLSTHPALKNTVSRNVIANLLHEATLLRSSKQVRKDIKLHGGRIASLTQCADTGISLCIH